MHAKGRAYDSSKNGSLPLAGGFREGGSSTDSIQIAGKCLQDAFMDSGNFILTQGPGIGLIVAGKDKAFGAGGDFIT